MLCQGNQSPHGNQSQSEAMTLRAIFAALLMLIPAPSQAQSASSRVMQASATIKASNAFLDCLTREARRLDDGGSDAAVAKSAQAACLQEQHLWEDAQTANYTAEKKRAFLEGIKTHTAAIAVQIVVEKRRLKL